MIRNQPLSKIMLYNAGREGAQIVVGLETSLDKWVESTFSQVGTMQLAKNGN